MHKNILKFDPNTKESALIFFMVFLVTALILFPIGINRYVDLDEGFYLYSADLILHGKTLYTDFYYPQMPLLPYIFAGWFSLFGTGWVSGRIFVVLLCALIADLLFYWVFRETKQFRWAVVAVVLFIFNSLTAYGLLTAKTFSMTVVTSLLALILITDKSSKYRLLKSGFAGFLAGICFGTRLMAVPIILVVIPIALSDNFGGKWKRLLACFTGMALSLIPIFIFFFKNPQVFWFNNICSHSLRHAGGVSLIGNFQQKAKIILGMVGHTYTKGGIGAQFLLLLLPFLGIFPKLKRSSLSEIAALFFFLFMLAVSLLPTPTHYSYFAVSVPFIIFLGVLQLAKIYPSRVNTKFRLNFVWKWFAMVVVLYSLLAVPDILYCSWFYKTAENFSSAGAVTFSYKKDLDIKKIQEVSDYLKSNTAPNDYILSFWSGYLFGINRKAYPGTENHVVFSSLWNLSKYLSQKEVQSYHLVNSDDLRSIIKGGEVTTIVFAVGETEWSFDAKERKYWISLFDEAGYKLKKRFGRTGIYQLI